jgi:TolB-like protein/class 3 adenylate cyclase/Tfp pilus assembly protein PilF
MPDQKRQLAAIMFTDIVGYTAIMGKDSTKALELVRISKEIQKPLVEKNNGKWLKEMGDGALAKFSTALDAVNCSIEIQEHARAKFDGKLRIGIHLGDITIENDDVYGDGVNIASRLESITDPGGIYISESIEKAIRGQIDVQAKYLGEIKLKNVDYDVRTYALQGVGLPIPNLKEDKNLSGRFIAELQRRGVFRAGATYIVLSLLLILLVPYGQSLVDLPTWFLTVLYAILIVGLPIAMYLAWNYERSPEGFVKTTSRQSWQNPYKASQRKPMTSNFIIVGLILIIAVMFLNPLDILSPERDVVVDTSDPFLDKSIAVLPFANDSPDAENEYFCNGMMEEILNQLQKIGDLRVKSRTSAEQYRNEVKDIQTIGKEMSVSFVLEGSVRKAGDDIRITTQLIDVKTGDHLWSETYDGNYTQKIFDFQSTVAKKVASSLNVIINPEEEKRLDKKSTNEIMAYDLFWQGMDMADNFTYTHEEKYLESANVLFEKALVIDPDYALAIYGKGHVLKIKADRTSRNYDSAMIYADRAILLDPMNMEGYGLKASIYQAEGQSDLAIEYYLKAVELNPDWNWTNFLLGTIYYFGKNDYQNGLYYINKSLNGGEGRAWPSFYGYLGRFFHGIGDYQRSMKYYRQSLILQPHRRSITGYFQSLLSQHKVHEAINYLDSACIILVNEPVCSILKFYAHLDLENYNQAEKYFNQFLNDAGKPNLQDSIWFSYLLKKTGREKEANLILKNSKIAIEKQLSGRGRAWRLYNLSAIYAIQNDKSASLKYLEDAFVRSNGRLYDDQIEIDPIFENLWDDPEFLTIVKKAQDEKAAIRAQVREMEERGEIDL